VYSEADFGLRRRLKWGVARVRTRMGVLMVRRLLPLTLIAPGLVLGGCTEPQTAVDAPSSLPSGHISAAPVVVGPQMASMTAIAVAADPGSQPAVGPGSAQRPHYVIGKPYQFDGTWYRPQVDYEYDETGLAAIYRRDAKGEVTTDGEIYDDASLTAAHKTLPLPSVVRVTNQLNGRTIELRVNDRGPFLDNHIIQLSGAAADRLGILPGTSTRVRVQVMPDESRALAAELGTRGAISEEHLPAVPAPKVTTQPLQQPSIKPQLPIGTNAAWLPLPPTAEDTAPGAQLADAGPEASWDPLPAPSLNPTVPPKFESQDPKPAALRPQPEPRQLAAAEPVSLPQVADLPRATADPAPKFDPIALALPGLGEGPVLGPQLASAVPIPLSSSPAPETAAVHYIIGRPYQFDGVWYRPTIDYGYDETGRASVYRSGVNGEATTDGEIYDERALTAAHKTLPLPSVVRVTNVENGQSLQLKVNDRGPFADDRLIELSRHAAELLGIEPGSTSEVRVQVMAEESRRLAASLGEPVPVGNPNPPPAGTNSAAVPWQPAAVELAYVEPRRHVPIGPQLASLADVSVPTKSAVPHMTEQSDDVTPLWSERFDHGLLTGDDEPAKISIGPDSARFLSAARPQASAAPVSIDREVAALPAPAVPEIFVQAGAFLNPDNATRLRGKLAVVGSAKVVPVERNGKQYSAVWIGPMASAAEVQRVQKRMAALGYKDALLIGE
jgi:rare lipoprotein A